MRIYLSHTGNVAAEGDGYMVGQREAEHELALLSFFYCNGSTLYKINHAARSLFLIPPSKDNDHERRSLD